MSEHQQGSVDAALAYAARGWRVAPIYAPTGDGCSCLDAKICGSPGKHPWTGPNGKSYRSATTDEATIREWYRIRPLYGVGIATGPESGLLVLDVDKKHGGLETLKTIFTAEHPLPRTPVVATGGGGVHIYFAFPSGIEKLPLELGPGVEVKGDGRGVVAPPSKHASGGCYAWDAFEDAPPAQVPDFLRGLLRDASKKKPKQEASTRRSNDARAEPESAVAGPARLTMSFAEFELETIEKADSLWGEAFLVRAGGYLILGGDGGVGKTILLVNLAIYLAAGEEEFLGHKLPGRPVPVLFIEAEGSRAAFRDWVVRIAKSIGYSPEKLPLYFKTRAATIDLDNNLRQMIRETGAELAVLDPIGAFFEGEENSTKEWRSGVTRPLAKIADELSVVFAFSDHYTKPSETRTGRHKLRGSAAKVQDCGCAMRLEIGEGGKASRVLFIDRVRDGETPEKDMLKLAVDLKAGTIECIGIGEAPDFVYSDSRLDDLRTLFEGGKVESPIKRGELEAAIFSHLGLERTRAATLIANAKLAGVLAQPHRRGPYEFVKGAA